jgi:hypothetical protein
MGDMEVRINKILIQAPEKVEWSVSKDGQLTFHIQFPILPRCKISWTLQGSKQW